MQLKGKPGECKLPYENLARPAGFEPTTPWFVGDLGQFVVVRNQRLAALADSLPKHIKAQVGHSQSELVAILSRAAIAYGARVPAYPNTSSARPSDPDKRATKMATKQSPGLRGRSARKTEKKHRRATQRSKQQW
jgi:hypothetical protein